MSLQLKLHENIQFIYELVLAQKELRTFGIEFHVTNHLRTFTIPKDTNPTDILRRSAYFATVDGQFTDYHFIQKCNQTQSVNQYLTHWIYPYKGKYHPQMIRALLNITQVKPGEIVLDPFIGSGTTSLECQLLGIKCIGIDVSPLCVMLSKVKTESVAVLDQIKDLVGRVSVTSDLFRLGIDHIEDPRVRNFFRTAEMVAHSDSSRRGKDFERSFHENLTKMVKSVADLRDISKRLQLNLVMPEIYEGDARRLIHIRDNSVDALITSPPYSIALNYVENDAHALKALGYDLSRIKDDFIGVRGTAKTKFDLYYDDMALCYKEMYRVLKPQKYCVVVIGNVTQQKEEIDTKGKTIELCKGAGFELVENIEKIIYGLYNVMQKDYILIFKRP